MNEFELIRRHFATLTGPAEDVRLGIGDDCALLSVPPGQTLAVTSDTLIAGRHFPEATAPADIGWKALAVNLSDLAAMAAQARWFTLALSLPAADENWVAGFASGLRELAMQTGVSLVGGDTTRGPLSITITAMGLVPEHLALKRSGARPGDLIAVSGTLGDAALGLQRVLAGEGARDALRARLDRPMPRLALGLALRGIASAALDLSDGLVGDLSHILAASGVGARVWADRLPASPEFLAGSAPEARFALQAAGGDDYELCLCVPPDRWPQAQAAEAALNLPLTAIGEIREEPGLEWLADDGTHLPFTSSGYRHF